jgi:hypothetical protein
MKALVVVGWIALAASRAHAEPARIEVDGVCALESIAERVRDITGAIDSRAIVYVTTEQHDNRVRAQVVLVEGGHRSHPPRTIAAASCDELGDAVAVIVSVLLREQRPTVVIEAKTESEREREIEVDAEQAPVAVPRQRPQQALDLSVATTDDSRGVVMLAFRTPVGPIEVGAELGVHSSEQLEAASGRVTVSRARTAIVPCFAYRQLAVCGLLSVGWIRGSGKDLMDVRTVTFPRGEAGGRLEWRQALTRRMGLRLFGEATHAFNQVEFLVDQVPVWRAPTSELVFGGGAFLNFP